MMKCYKCGKEVSAKAVHCEYCGSLLKVTNKLLTAIRASNTEAIIMLYKMLYNQVYNRFLQLGIEKQDIPALINKAYKDFLTHFQEVTSIEAFEPYFNGICDNAAFTYLKEHNLEPRECDQEVFVRLDQEKIDEMLASLQEKEKPTTAKKKSHKAIIYVVVIALVVVVGVGGAFGYKTMKEQTVEKKRTKAFADVSLQYVEAVKTMATSGNYNPYQKIKKRYPLADGPAFATLARGSTINFFDKNSLVSVKYDVDGDDEKELLVGYKDGKKTIITGIYKNNGKKTVLINPIRKVLEDTILIFTTDHKIIRGIREYENKPYVYSLLRLKNNKLVTLKSSIHNLSEYMKKNGLKKAPVTAKPIQYDQKQIKLLPSDQDRWLQYIKNGQYKKADALGEKMDTNVEDPCVTAMSKKMKEAYLNKVTKYMWDYDGFNENADGYVRSVSGYMLTDMDGDHLPELIIKWGTGSNVDENFAIFTYKNDQLKTINEKVGVGIHSEFLYYPNHAGIINNMGYMGIQEISIMSVKNGKVKENKIAKLPEVENADLYVKAGLELTLHINSEDEVGAGNLNLTILNSD